MSVAGHPPAVEIVGIDEVDLEELLELHHECFSYPITPESIRRMRLIDDRLPRRVGYYARDGPRLLGQVELLTFDVSTTAGTEHVGGIWGVCTRSDRGRERIARTLMEAAHAGFREEGLDLVLLMTSRSFVAHTFYRALGYHDLTQFPWAVRRVRAGPDAPTARSGSTDGGAGPDTVAAADAAGGRDSDALSLAWAVREDLAALYWIYRQTVDGRLGFVHRARNFIERAEAWGDVDLEQVCTARRSDRIDGYAILRQTIAGTEIREIAGPPATIAPFIRLIEQASGGTHVIASTLFHPDQREAFRTAGYRFHERSWGSLLALSLTGRPAESIRAALGIGTGRFQLAGIDRF